VVWLWVHGRFLSTRPPAAVHKVPDTPYLSNLRRYIKTLDKVRLIDEPMRARLCIIGKHSVDQVDKNVTQQALDLYWRLLLDEKVAGKQPTISRRCGMRMSQMTAVLDVCDTTRLTKWWLAFSHLVPGKRIQLPLVGTPYITSIDQASKGILARKTKHGRWRFEVVDTKGWEAPVATRDMPRVGLDVGLNVMAATSDGRLLGAELKPKFNADYAKIRELRANRQRQELKQNSPRLDCLESKLSGLVKSMAGKVANDLIRAYPDAAFVIEDLDLRGCRGQKRMAYRALHHNLQTKAPCIVVNPAYTSQACPSCGFVARANRRGTRFVCRSCGRTSHADVVGAINLLRRSEDKEVACADHPSEVKPILKARHEAWRMRQASLCSSGRRMHAPAPSGRRLTTRVPNGTGTASNQVPLST
jgi:predicted RNA-binding Zn-ribbon protein involved in translation (DUF1610 family)